MDLDAGVLHLRQGLHWSEGWLQMAKDAADSLHPWPPVELRFTTVVGKPVDPNNFSRTFARWCREAEVPAVRLHDLRHTCVSMLLTLGMVLGR